MKNDQISRQATLEALLDKGQRSRRYKLGDVWELNFDEIREVINALPAADPHWTPCSKELPKKDGDYWVTTYDGQTTRYLFIRGLSDEYWMRCVTAWMPLPEPYREEHDD